MVVIHQFDVPAALPLQRKDPLVPNAYRAGWAPEPVWTLQRGEKMYCPARNGMPVIQPVSCLNGVPRSKRTDTVILRIWNNSFNSVTVLKPTTKNVHDKNIKERDTHPRS
jgi:hypothetical protein